MTRFVDSLESRRLMATYGNPWPDGSRMTLSFAPDGAGIVGAPSSLFAALDAALPRQEWQAQIARAFQRWAIHTDVNVGVRADQGQAFGTPGFTLGDPRFGDVRIGAHEMTSDVLAISVPFDPARAGTLTGDVFLNSGFAFDGTPYDLTTVMLHEAGHVFGLDHSDDPASPMYSRFNNPIGDLIPSDVARIRALYGDRAPDRFDAASPNDMPGDASPIPTPNTFDGQTPLAAFGDLTTAGDVDFLKFQTPSDDNGYVGPITVRLRTAGISLMQPSVSVLRPDGTAIATSTSSSLLGDTLTVTFNAGGDDNDFLLRIDSPATDEFAIGAYALAVSFDGRNMISTGAIDAVLTGPHDAADADTLRQLFLNAGGVFLNADAGQNDAIGAAAPLTSTRPGHFETIGSIESIGDVDFYKLDPPANNGLPITVHLWTTDPRGLAPRVRPMTATGTPIAVRTIANGNGMVVLQIDNAAAANAPIVIATSGARGTGNYFLSVDRTTPTSMLTPFASGSSVVRGTARVDSLYVAQAQLMHFLLTVEPGASTAAMLEMQIVDAAGRIVFRLTSRPGESASRESALLTPGEYRVRYITSVPFVRPRTEMASVASPSAVTSSHSFVLRSRLEPISSREAITRPTSISRASLQFTLAGSTLSGPIGPSLRNPLLRPRFLHPSIPDAFLFPTRSTSRDAWQWVERVV